MAAADQMAGYAAHLNANTPSSSKGRPVTEIAIFTLQAPYDEDHTAARDEFVSQIVTNCRPGAPYAKGIRKIAWGFDPTDPKAFIWMLDWTRIEDHWDFWLTPGFPPVMAAISKLFTPGRPLVRHYDFGEQGMLGKSAKFAKLAVWDDGQEGKAQEQASKISTTDNGDLDRREAYAVDLDEDTWWATMVAYQSEGDAKEAEVKGKEGAVVHNIKLEYDGPQLQ